MSVTQVMEQYQSILEEEIHDIAYETGAVKRKGKLDIVTFVQMMIFGFWQDPALRLSGLAQIGCRREVQVTESAISQRFTPACALMFLKIMQRLAEVVLEGEKVDIPLLKQFSAVWQGCGKEGSAGSAVVKAFVRWNMVNGELLGPRLTNGRMNDHQSPFGIEELPDRPLYIADIGFFAIERLCRIARESKEKRCFIVFCVNSMRKCAQ